MTVQTLRHLTIMCLARLRKHCEEEDFTATTRWRRRRISGFDNNQNPFFFYWITQACRNMWRVHCKGRWLHGKTTSYLPLLTEVPTYNILIRTDSTLLIADTTPLYVKKFYPYMMTSISICRENRVLVCLLIAIVVPYDFFHSTTFKVYHYLLMILLLSSMYLTYRDSRHSKFQISCRFSRSLCRCK
jgi:hypothetical protein